MFENGDFDLDANWFTDDFTSASNSDSPNNKSQHPKYIHNDCQAETKNLVAKTNTFVSPKKKIVVKRKFPGPAGLVSQVQGIDREKNVQKNDSSFLLSTQMLCSQNPIEVFEKSTWLDMSRDFKDTFLMEKYNIQWIYDNMPLKSTYKRMPFLAAIIKEVKNTSKVPNYVLADSTGEIEASISMEVRDKYNLFLSDYSVIILKQFGILSVSSYKHYININDDSLIRIYTCKDVTDPEVTVIHVQQMASEDLKVKVEEFANKCKQCGSNGWKEEYNIQSRNSLKPKRSFNLSGDNNKNINKESTEANMENLQSKFKFKYVSTNEGSVTTNSIFDQLDNSLDLDLSADDFADDFLCSSEALNANVGKNKDILHLQNDVRAGTSPSKKVRLDSNAKTGGNTKFCGLNNKEDLNREESLKNKIDCSQISVISQNVDNFDVTEVFCDLEAADLFGEF